jgi:hypothetical protein
MSMEPNRRGRLTQVTLVLKEDGTVDRLGIETDYRTRLIKRANGIVVIKLPGGKHWTGRGLPQRYHGAEYEVYQEVEMPDAIAYPKPAGAEYVRCERLLDFPVRDDK